MHARREFTPLESPRVYFSLWVVIAGIIYVSVLPSVYLIIWAFAGTETVGVLNSADKVSLRWFWQLLENPEWQASLLYSAIVAVVTSFIGTVILFIHFYAMRYSKPFLDHLAYLSILSIILIPAVTYALALRLVGGRLRLPEALVLALGHLITILPLQFFILESRQETVPTNLLFAGSTMGASHTNNILFVYMPLMKEAFLYAFALGFFASFDELVIATFVLDSPLVTVPRRLWSEVDRSMDPSPAVISCLLLLAIVAVVFLWRLVAVARRGLTAWRT